MHRLGFTGFPSPAEDYQRPALSLDRLIIHFPLQTFFCRYYGNAMAGSGIHHGDLLVIERQMDYKPGQIVLAFYNSDRVIRLLEESPDGLALCPTSPNHKVIPVTEYIEIFGRVTHSITSHLKLKLLDEMMEAS